METEQVQKARGQDRPAKLNGSGQGPREAVVSSGISLRLWRLYAQAWLVCLLFPIVFLVQTRLAPMPLLAAVAGLAVFVGTYTWFMWPHPLDGGARARSGLPTAPIALAGLVALVLSLSLAYGSAFLWLFVGVSAVAGVALSARGAFVAVGPGHPAYHRWD